MTLYRYRIIGVGSGPPVCRNGSRQDNSRIVQRLVTPGKLIRNVANHDHVITNRLVISMPSVIVTTTVQTSCCKEVVLVAQLNNIWPFNLITDHRCGKQRRIKLTNLRILNVIVEFQNTDGSVGPAGPTPHVVIGKQVEEVVDVKFITAPIVLPVVDLV